MLKTAAGIVDVILDPDVVGLVSVAITDPLLLFEYLTSLPDADMSLQLITKVLPDTPFKMLPVTELIVGAALVPTHTLPL